MMPDERAARIRELQGQADEHRENIAEREDARAQNPILMHEYIRAEQQTAPVQRDVGQAELLYRVTETVSAPVQTADVMDAETQAKWDNWVKAHLANERAEVIDQVTRIVAEFTSEYTFQKLQPLRTEIADLKRTLQERDERAHALSELKREFQGERTEHQALQLAAALAMRDHRIDALEERVQTLMRFMSLAGIDPPKGL
jgi:hypothetical protein